MLRWVAVVAAVLLLVLLYQLVTAHFGGPARQWLGLSVNSSQCHGKPCTLLLMHRDGIDLSGRGLAQGYQDQILRSIFRCIGATNKYFVEFGFNDASYEIRGTGSGANTYGLYVDGWRGLLLDAEYYNET
eukprot:RCo026066